MVDTSAAGVMTYDSCNQPIPILPLQNCHSTHLETGGRLLCLFSHPDVFRPYLYSELEQRLKRILFVLLRIQLWI